jgi:hypothetical protein
MVISTHTKRLNGFHEKASLVKVNVVTEAETKAAKRERLLPRFHSHSL